MGTKEDESSTGCIWAAGFHRIAARSRLARVLKLMNHLFNVRFFFSGCGKLQILNQRILGHTCILNSFFFLLYLGFILITVRFLML
jgi:hypothetical protein